MIFSDADGVDVLDIKMDYISETDSIVSGYDTLGVTDGNGKVVMGQAEHVLRVQTSLANNLNERGYDAFSQDSPATDQNYAPSAEAPDWDYRVVYEVWLDHDAFADVGFGAVRLELVHASPSKIDVNTVPVTPEECPPDWTDSEDPDDPVHEQPM